MILETLRHGFLPALQARCRNDGSQRFLRRTLNALLAMTIMLTPCQAAIKLDGINDHISIGSLSISAPLTFSFWVNLKSYSSAFPNLISSASGNLAIGTTATQSFYASGLYFTASPIPLNVWVYRTYIISGGNINLYNNGVFVESRPFATTNFNGFTLGCYHSLAYYSNSEIDDVRVYNRPLTTTEIESLYHSRSKRPSGSLANGLVAHYEMDDNAIGEITAQAKDSSGNLNHGQFIGFDNLVSNGFSMDVPAQIGNGHSLEFDGVDDYISSSATTNSVVYANNYSMSIWIKPSGVAPTVPINQTWLAGILGDSGGFFSIGRANITGEGDRVYAYNYPGIDRHVSAAYNIDEWTHLVTVQNGGNLKFYKDNNFIGSIASSGPSALPGNILIGRVGSLIYHEFTGNVDDAYIYNRALTASEVSFLYNGSGLNPGTSNLQALWTFDNDSALKDSSGNNNHGVGVGGESLKYTEGILRR